jgi:DNA-binding NtrC family response regulator
MPRKPLDLVDFVGHEESDQLRRQLTAGGWSVNSISGSEWLKASATASNAQVRVLIPAAPEPRTREIVQALARWPLPTMAVLVVRDAFDRTLADRCEDFVLRPCAQHELSVRLSRLAGSDSPADVPSRALRDEFASMNLVGNSAVFLGALASIKKIARCEAPVLIEGETGTGKELAARAVHYLGSRAAYPFIPVNTGALPDSLVENELFGHERGAFTDARDSQLGLVAQAEGGTLFLDEVDTLSAKGQVTLLRFLQDQRYQPLGAAQARQANVRVIAGTNAVLEERVAAGAFRQDLLYRLRVLAIQLPPLRERTGDARVLAEHFIRQYSARYGCEPKAMHWSLISWLDTHAWPGNVRELESFIHRQMLLTGDASVMMKPSQRVSECREQGNFVSFNQAKRETIAEFERGFLLRTLVRANGNVTLAAEMVGKERRAFGKLLKKYGIDSTRHRMSS